MDNNIVNLFMLWKLEIKNQSDENIWKETIKINSNILFDAYIQSNKLYAAPTFNLLRII